MSTFYLEYPLQGGYVHNWLVAGPHAAPVHDLERFQGPDFKLQIARERHKKISEIHEPPVERGSFELADSELVWKYYRCQDDHLVDLSTFFHTCHHLRAWAYSQLAAPASQKVTLVLTTNGPADVWLNGQHVHRQEHFHHQQPFSVPFQATLAKGRNEILVRFEEVAARECPYAMALQVCDLGDQEILVCVPTDIENTKRRLMFERTFEHAYLERSIDHGGSHAVMRWSDELQGECACAFRLMDWRNRIYLEGMPVAKAGEKMDAGQQLRLEEGPYHIFLMPQPEEYYRANMRYQRLLPFRILASEYSTSLYNTYEDRRREALEYATRQRNDLYAEIAKIALRRWASADLNLIAETIEKINQRGDCSDFYLVGLLGVLLRYPSTPAYSADVKQALQDCALNFKYWHDEPGSDAMCYTTENHSILFHTCEILAGQLYPDSVFTNANQTGQWHREKGERLALEWLYTRGTTGFSEWDSNCYFEEDLLALSHLAELAENETVRELAAVVMDKMFFTIALNSFKGVFGSTHGRTYAPMVKGGELEATSGITRLMWGMGIWNDHIRGTVALACSNYELPPHIYGIAVDPLEEMWDRERHPGVNKVTFKTPDYMLCSAQDYNPGEKGYQQHIWQATLGPDAVAFVTHPPCASEEGAHRPNFWHGNFRLPRVAQWKDTLVALYDLPEDDWMGFTHAYFPVYEFDEHRLETNWAFARKGEGYLALYAAQGLKLTTQGDSAYRELRSHGQQQVWLCLMGRQAVDGSFEAFQEKALALPVDVRGLSVRCTTLRSEVLAFGWEGPLLINGDEQPLSDFPHYENPYCIAEFPATQMDILYGEYAVRLHFELDSEEADGEQQE